METYMETLGCRAKEASRAAAKLTTVEKNRGLEFVAEELCLRKEELLSENEKDMEAAREQGMSEALQDRLRLTQARIEAMAEGFETDCRAFRSDRGSPFHEKPAEWTAYREKESAARCCWYYLRIQTKCHSRCVRAVF